MSSPTSAVISVASERLAARGAGLPLRASLRRDRKDDLATAARHCRAVDIGLWFLVFGIALAGLGTYAFMRMGAFGQPGATPRDDIRRVTRWGITGLAVWAVAGLAVVSCVALADASVTRPKDAPLAAVPAFLGVVIALGAYFIRQRLR